MSTDTGVDPPSLGYGYHNKACYAVGLYWFFYTDGTDGKYIYSANGSSWTAATFRTGITAGNTFDTWFDGTYIHYVYESTSNIYYRRGTLVSDGSISWSAAEQSFAESTTVNRPTICVNSSGYAFIGFCDTTADAGQPWIYKNANNDGTWSTDGGAVQLNTGGTDTAAYDSWRVHLALSSGVVVATYGRSYGSLYAKKHSSGTTWGSEEVAYSAYGLDYGYVPSLGSDDSGNIYVLLINYTPYDYVVVKRSSAGSWSNLGTIDDTGDYVYYSLSISVLDNGDLYCFISNKPTADYVQYKRYISSSWDANWTNWEAGTSIQNGGNLISIHDVVSGKIAVFWRENTSNLMFSSIDTGGVTNPVYIYYGIFR